MIAAKPIIFDPLNNLISMIVGEKPFVPKDTSKQSLGMIDIRPLSPAKQTLRKSPNVGATTAEIVFGLRKANNAMS